MKLLAHHVTSASLIHLLVLQMSDDQEEGWGDQSMMVSSVESHQLMILALKMIRNTNLSWHEFENRVKLAASASFISAFKKQVLDLTDISLLCEAVKSYEGLLDNESITRDSVMGLFLRKVILNFKKMSIEKVVELVDCIKTYLSVSHVGQTTPEASQIMEQSLNSSNVMEQSFNDSVLMDQSVDNSTIMEQSSNVAESDTSILEKNISESNDPDKENKIELISLIKNDKSSAMLLSANEVQRFISTQIAFVQNSDKLALSPKELHQRCEQIRKHFPDIVDVYQLHFLNYMRVADAEKATASLQLYFDLKVFQGEQNDVVATEFEKHQQNFLRFSFCALNLGIMHCELGNYGESVMYLKEAIRMAQEKSEEKALKQALFWLQVVAEETNDRESIDNNRRCLTEWRQHEELPELSNIDYLTVLRAFKSEVYQGQVEPSQVLADIHKALSANRKMANAASLMDSALLLLYGFNTIAISRCQLPLLTSTCTSRISAENLVLSLSQLVHNMYLQGYFTEATGLLEFAKSQISIFSQQHKILRFCERQFNFHRCVMRRDVNELNKILSGLPLSSQSLEVCYMEVVSKVLEGNLTEADCRIKSIIEKLTKEQLKNESPSLEAKFRLLLIELNLCDNKSAAIQPICQLINFSKKYHLLNVDIDARICLADVYLHLKMYSKAAKQLDSIMLMTFAHGTCFQRGNVLLLRARCKFHSELSLADNEDLGAGLARILELLGRSWLYFDRCESVAKKLDILYIQACTHHHLGETAERHKVSGMYRALHMKLNPSSPATLTF